MDERTFLRRLGTRIRTLRKSKQLSLAEAAERAEVDPNYLGRIERGEKNASIEVLARVADALGASVGDLVRAHDRRPREDLVAQITGCLDVLSVDQLALLEQLARELGAPRRPT